MHPQDPRRFHDPPARRLQHLPDVLGLDLRQRRSLERWRCSFCDPGLQHHGDEPWLPARLLQRPEPPAKLVFGVLPYSRHHHVPLLAEQIADGRQEITRHFQTQWARWEGATEPRDNGSVYADSENARVHPGTDGSSRSNR